MQWGGGGGGRASGSSSLSSEATCIVKQLQGCSHHSSEGSWREEVQDILPAFQEAYNNIQCRLEGIVKRLSALHHGPPVGPRRGTQNLYKKIEGAGE